MISNIELIFPEIFLSLSIMFLLILGVFMKDSSKIIQNTSLVVLLATTVITFNETIGVGQITLFNQSIIIDYLSSFMKIITLIAAFVAQIASSILSCFSFNSISELAPTFTIATFADNLANLVSNPITS